MKRKLMRILTTVFVVSVCTAGCGEKDTETDATTVTENTVQTVSVAETPEPTPAEKKQEPFNNADDLLKAFFENTDDNYNSVYEVHSERTIFKNIHDPVTFIEDKKRDTDRSGNYTHGTVSVYQKANTSESNHETEVFSEKTGDSYIFYTNETTSDEWEKEEYDYFSRGEDDLLNKLHAYNEDIDPKFTYDDKKEQYELVLTGAEFLFDAPDSEDVLSSMDPMQQSYVEHMMDATANLKIHYIIDKDLHLVNIKSDDIKFNVDFEDKAIDLIGYVEYLMNVNVTYSEFGEIKATDVTVPARIKESFSESYIEESPILSEEELAACGEPDDSLSDFYGSIEEVNLQAIVENDFDKTFGAAGFLQDEDNRSKSELNDIFKTFGNAGFLLDEDKGMKTGVAVAYMMSDDYPGIIASVFPEDIEREYDDLTEEIVDNGFWGYTINVKDCVTSRPNMTFGGLTWGASMLDILAVYGTPHKITEKYNSEVLTYYFDAILQFVIDKGDGSEEDSSGLYAVQMLPW